MEKSCYNLIKNYISSAPKGTVFATADFKQFGSAEAVRKSLSRLAKESVCRRLVPGIYYCPYYSLLLKKEVLPASVDVARALARNYNWTIIPSPIHAQNELGVSTQVPAEVSFTSTGPSRKYIINNIPIIFRHSRSKYMNRMSYKSALVTNALQDLKSSGVNKDAVNAVASRLTIDEKKSLREELRFAPVWLQPHLEEIITM